MLEPTGQRETMIKRPLDLFLLTGHSPMPRQCGNGTVSEVVTSGLRREGPRGIRRSRSTDVNEDDGGRGLGRPEVWV